jgi:hypothetical protein
VICMLDARGANVVQGAVARAIDIKQIQKPADVAGRLVAPSHAQWAIAQQKGLSRWGTL